MPLVLASLSPQDSSLLLGENLKAIITKTTLSQWFVVLRLLEDDDEDVRQKAAEFVSAHVSKLRSEKVCFHFCSGLALTFPRLQNPLGVVPKRSLKDFRI